MKISQIKLLIKYVKSLLFSDQHMIASFGEDIYNELYIVGSLGAIYKIQKGKQLKDLGIEIINLHKKYDDV